uniref:DNA-binding transcription factor NET n=3 Tax=Drosophila melanogaster TaxID=7227 RepID=Q7KH24_DROME|nr:DNA-binding transcription factor NET [Drosophila melanogaster]ACJ13166.1 FI03708p [Drosophila melanogaster]ACM16716.1 FI10001p [Drosophila melanogaster]AOQ10620.1 net-RB [synthetic construct]AOQ14345.1 net-PB [synthetic construct]
MSFAAMANTNTEKLYMQLSASELSAIIMKDSPNSNDRDAGFCSASSESEGGDDLVVEHARSGSPDIRPKGTDSADSKPIALVRNKRKSSEPFKVVGLTTPNSKSMPGPPSSASMNATGPLKKRIRYTSSADSAVVLTPPAIDSPPPNSCIPSTLRLQHEIMPNPAHIYVRHPGVTTLHRSLAAHPEQLEPLALVTTKKQCVDQAGPKIEAFSALLIGKQPSAKKTLKERTQKESTSSSFLEASLSDEDLNKTGLAPISRPHQHQRNYKNMTRERRIEANARERTRVHTISAAYETLRQAVPAYASTQKLSKLSVLRVACSYILTLSRMAGEDYSADQSVPSIATCLEAVTSTIQTEGKVKRKKDE